MEEGDFDLCECIWSHNMAMRRLLSLLRGSQAYCTDNECLNELPLSNTDTTSEANFFFIAVCWFILAMVLYFLRPNTFRRQEEDLLKMRNNDNDRNDNSSEPPPLD